MATEQASQFIKELRALARRYDLTVGGGGRAGAVPVFNIGFRAMPAVDTHTGHPCMKCEGESHD